MATTTDFKLHDHAGIRWFAPMMVFLAITLIGIFMMLIYPHVTG